jgi:hypothetical protein
MPSALLFRWSAVALVVSGVSLAAGLVLHPMPPYDANVGTWHWAVSHFFWWAGALTGIAGLSGLYLRQREEVGVLGFIGIGLAVIGLVLITGAMHFEAFIAPSLAARAPEVFRSFPAGGGWEGFLAGVLASGALFGLGFLAFAFAMFRARTMPRWAVALAAAGGPPVAVNFLLPHLVAIVAVLAFAVGLSGLASALWKSAERPVGRSLDASSAAEARETPRRRVAT